MFGSNRRNSFDDVFSFQREMDRVFNQFWNELPTRTAAPPSPSPSSSLQVTATDDGWRVDVPLPGIDPRTWRLKSLAIISAFAPKSPAKARIRTSHATSKRWLFRSSSTWRN